MAGPAWFVCLTEIVSMTKTCQDRWTEQTAQQKTTSQLIHFNFILNLSSFFMFKCILGICLVLCCLFLHDFAITCPVVGLNVAVQHGNLARLGLWPGF